MNPNISTRQPSTQRHQTISQPIIPHPRANNQFPPQLSHYFTHTHVQEQSPQHLFFQKVKKQRQSRIEKEYQNNYSYPVVNFHANLKSEDQFQPAYEPDPVKEERIKVQAQEMGQLQSDVYQQEQQQSKPLVNVQVKKKVTQPQFLRQQQTANQIRSHHPNIPTQPVQLIHTPRPLYQYPQQDPHATSNNPRLTQQILPLQFIPIVSQVSPLQLRQEPVQPIIEGKQKNSRLSGQVGYGVGNMVNINRNSQQLAINPRYQQSPQPILNPQVVNIPPKVIQRNSQMSSHIIQQDIGQPVNIISHQIMQPLVVKNYGYEYYQGQYDAQGEEQYNQEQYLQEQYAQEQQQQDQEFYQHENQYAQQLRQQNYNEHQYYQQLKYQQQFQQLQYQQQYQQEQYQPEQHSYQDNQIHYLPQYQPTQQQLRSISTPQLIQLQCPQCNCRISIQSNTANLEISQPLPESRNMTSYNHLTDNKISHPSMNSYGNKYEMTPIDNYYAQFSSFGKLGKTFPQQVEEVAYSSPYAVNSKIYNNQSESKLTNSPYKVFKPNIEQAKRDIVFDGKGKEKNKDYYPYVYIMQKNIGLIQNPLDSQVKSSNIALNSFNR